MAEHDRLQWCKVGTTEADLLRELQDLYWNALEAELADAFLSLKWILEARTSNPDANVGPSDITERISKRLGPPMWEWNPLGLDLENIIEACMPEALEYTREMQDRPDELLLARYMLCGLGMLDIDEVVEYREPVLPSQNGPPRVSAEKNDATGAIEISATYCDVCGKPIRGTAWICGVGCRSIEQASDSGPFIMCMPCYYKGEHQHQHLVRSPHSYAISPSLQAELSPEDFWTLRRRIQREQSAIDAQQDKSEQGFVKSTLFQAMTPASRTLFPLGNVHSSLMFGPLLFEIGVPDSEGGVRISCRRPPNLAKTWSSLRQETTVSVSPDRQISKAQTWLVHRPVQATIKQVLGGAFSGYYSLYEAFESFAVQMVLAGSKKWQQRPLRSREANYKSLSKMARKLVAPLKFMFGSNVKSFLQIFTRVLFDRNTDFRWSKYSNNCQSFCDMILSQPEFSTVFPRREQLQSRPSAKSSVLDYLISFRTHSQLGRTLEASLLSIGPLTTFFKQLHNPSNALSAQEGAVNVAYDGNPPLCARLMLWRCQSEDCSLADHVWTNPAEYTSILQLHLLLERSHYVQESKDEGGTSAPLNDLQWIENRVAVLQALDCFATAAAGIARTFQDRLAADESITWTPPSPYCIPHDYPFVCEGDSIQMTQQDPLPDISILGRLFGGAGQGPHIDLPGYAEPDFKVKIL